MNGYKNLVANLKKDPLNPKSEDLRLINATVLILQAVFSFLLPSLIRGFTGGFGGISTDYKVC